MNSNDRSTRAAPRPCGSGSRCRFPGKGNSFELDCPARSFILAELCILSAAILSGQGFSHGTSEVVIVSATAIVAAIDSKEINREYLSDGTSISEDRIACKVKQVGPTYVLVAGISRATDGFNALREAAILYRTGESLNDFAAHLVDAIPALLAPLLDVLRGANATAFDLSYRNRDVLQLTVLGVERGRPRVIVVTFHASQSGLRGVVIDVLLASCPGDCQNPYTVYALGIREEVESFLPSDPAGVGNTSTSRALQLIKLEYVSHPEFVGGPASVVRVTEAGAVLEQTGACVDDGEFPQLKRELDRAISDVADVVVHEDISQSSKHGSKVHSGGVQANVRVVGGTEEYTWNYPSGNRSHLPEPWCSGELSTMMWVTRQLLEQGRGTLSADTFPDLKPAVVAEFHVTAADRNWQLVVGSRTYPLAFDGRAWFSRTTGQLVRIQWETADLRLPASAGITRLEWDETFSTGEIAGQAFLTPSTAVYRVDYSRQLDRTDWTETRFSDFRRFGATEIVQFQPSCLPQRAITCPLRQIAMTPIGRPSRD